MQCNICKNQDELSNLVATKLLGEKVYAHRRCIKQHNKTAVKHLHAIDANANSVVNWMRECDLDATDEYVVREFLQRPERPRSFLSGRCPSVSEVTAVAYERRDRDRARWLFEMVEEQVGSWRAEPEPEPEAVIAEIAAKLSMLPPEAVIAEVADNLGMLPPDEGETFKHYAARLLVAAQGRGRVQAGDLYESEEFELIWPAPKLRRPLNASTTTEEETSHDRRRSPHQRQRASGQCREIALQLEQATDPADIRHVERRLKASNTRCVSGTLQHRGDKAGQ